jgi:hypothetical protein
VQALYKADNGSASGREACKRLIYPTPAGDGVAEGKQACKLCIKRTTVLPQAERRASALYTPPQRATVLPKQGGAQALYSLTPAGNGVAEGKEEKARRFVGLLDRSGATCPKGVSRLAEPANQRKRLI